MKDLYAIDVSTSEYQDDQTLIDIEWHGYNVFENPTEADAYGNPTAREVYEAASYIAGILARLAIELTGNNWSMDDTNAPSGIDGDVTTWELVKPYNDSTLQIQCTVRNRDVRTCLKRIRQALSDATQSLRTDLPAELDLDKPITGYGPTLTDAAPQTSTPAPDANHDDDRHQAC